MKEGRKDRFLEDTAALLFLRSPWLSSDSKGGVMWHQQRWY